jgi:hypothetical protein
MKNNDGITEKFSGKRTEDGRKIAVHKKLTERSAE